MRRRTGVSEVVARFIVFSQDTIQRWMIKREKEKE